MLLTVLFPSGKGGGVEVSYGYKGKGILIHLLFDLKGRILLACSTSVNED